MRSTDYGPVPLSRITIEVDGICAALEAGRRILIADRGQVVAVIDPVPVTLRGIPDNGMIFVHGNPELAVSKLEHGASSDAFTASLAGQPSYVTKAGKVCGLLRQVGPAELASEMPSMAKIRKAERLTSAFLEQNPGATAEQLATMGAEIDQLLGI